MVVGEADRERRRPEVLVARRSRVRPDERDPDRQHEHDAARRFRGEEVAQRVDDPQLARVIAFVRHSDDRREAREHELGLDDRPSVPYRAISSLALPPGDGARPARPEEEVCDVDRVVVPERGIGYVGPRRVARAGAGPRRLVRVPAGRSRRRPTRDLRARRRTRARAARLARRGSGDAHGGARPARDRSGAGLGAAPARWAGRGAHREARSAWPVPRWRWHCATDRSR